MVVDFSRVSVVAGFILCTLGALWAFATAAEGTAWRTVPSVTTSMLALVLISRHFAGSAVLRSRTVRAQRGDAYDMRNATEVQQTLLAHAGLTLSTLDVAGRTLQAREIGGDFCDVIPFAHGRTALLAGDVCGKGVSAALLMANLQALVRSQCVSGAAPVGVVASAVNGLFCKSTGHARFATMFMGLYDDWTRRLDYVNCGHNPPLLLRRDGTVERLRPTATVLGLFDEWIVDTGTVRLRAGDRLIVFSDGIVDAVDPDGHELGDDHLLTIVRQHLDLPADQLVETVLADVRAFVGAPMTDDATLLVACGR